jgi:hypothetical protein
MPPMTVDILKVVGDVGAIAVLILVLYGVWKYGGGFVTRLMDNLDQQSENNRAAIVAQQNMGSNLEKMCDRMDSHDKGAERRNQALVEHLAEIRDALSQNTSVLRGLQQQQQTHEARSAKRDLAIVERLEVMNGIHGNGGHDGEK